MDEHLAILANSVCEGLELSPSMIWSEPVDVPSYIIRKFKSRVNSFGLEIPSMHSLTYNRPDLHFFRSSESRKHLIDYLCRLGQIASELECSNLVFGSARSRSIGDLDSVQCTSLLVDSLGQIANRLAPLGVSILIEPLSEGETDCINTAEDAVELIQKVNHPNFALHIDLRSVFAGREDLENIWATYDTYVRHCHVADPDMRPPSLDCPEHLRAAKAIQSSSYDSYISIEIKRCFGETTKVVEKSINFVKHTYLFS